MKHPLFGMYSRWRDVVQRCRNPNHKRYAAYGGRGILLCERWTDFELFLADMGVCPPGLTLERDENDGNYEPGNCRWATYAEQAQNRRGDEATSIRTKELWRLQKAGLWPEGKNKLGRQPGAKKPPGNPQAA